MNKVNHRDNTSNVSIDEIDNGYILTLPMVVVTKDEYGEQIDYDYKTSRLFVLSVQGVTALIANHYSLPKYFN